MYLHSAAEVRRNSLARLVLAARQGSRPLQGAPECSRWNHPWPGLEWKSACIGHLDGNVIGKVRFSMGVWDFVLAALIGLIDLNPFWDLIFTPVAWVITFLT